MNKYTKVFGKIPRQGLIQVNGLCRYYDFTPVNKYFLKNILMKNTRVLDLILRNAVVHNIKLCRDEVISYE